MRCSEIYSEFNLSNCVGHSLPDLDRWVRHAVGMPTREDIDRKRLPFYEQVRSVKRHKSIQRLSANPRPTRTQHRPIRKVRSRPGGPSACTSINQHRAAHRIRVYNYARNAFLSYLV